MAKPSSRRKKATSAAEINSKPLSNSVNEAISVESNPATATITVTAVEIPELTEEEQRDRLLLERKVERAFFEAGKALTELRDRRLYRSTHKTFEEYCRVRPWRWRSHRFGHSRQQSNYLIAAAGVYENLTTIGCQKVANENLTTIGTQILPTSERQVRPMTKLEPQEQQEVWLRAVELAGGKVPTGRIVKDVVLRIMERTKVPNTYQIGEVCHIIVDLLHKSNRPPLIPPYKGGKLEILPLPNTYGEGWGGVIQGFLQEVFFTDFESRTAVLGCWSHPNCSHTC